MAANCDPRTSTEFFKLASSPPFVRRLRLDRWSTQKQITTKESFTVNGRLENLLVTK
jgi:hypothetical protein